LKKVRYNGLEPLYLRGGFMQQVDYSKVDPWVKKNEEGNFDAFVRSHPTVAISRWTFEKRRRIVLGLRLSPSMEKGYRPSKNGVSKTRSSCIYSTIANLSVVDIDGKKPIEIAQIIIEQLNSSLKLGLEVAQIVPVGNGNSPSIEIRRYSR
jgi:hypothetical protein